MTTRRRHPCLCESPNGGTLWRRGIAGMLFLIALTTTAHAGQQHLVRAGDDWSQLAQSVKPGDQIILMPGRHAPAQLDDLQGDARRPITIRALDPDECWIEADGYGLLLNRPRHVVVKNLTIVGADIAGLAMTGDPGPQSDDSESTWPGNVRIENVRIAQTGTVGERHAISLHGVRNVDIVGSRIEAWAGSAINISCSRDITIEDLTAVGSDQFSQLRIIRIHGESRRVRISRCRFSGALQQGLVIGANQARHSVCKPAEPDAPIHAAADVHIEHCVFLNTPLPVTILHASHVAILHCTFIRPRSVVLFCPDDAPADDNLAPTQHCTFGRNVIVWQPDDLERAMILPQRTSTSASDRPGRSGGRRSGRASAPPILTIDENLWWSPDSSQSLEALGGIPGGSSRPQRTSVDPQLDDQHRATAPGARGFGATE